MNHSRFARWLGAVLLLVGGSRAEAQVPISLPAVQEREVAAVQRIETELAKQTSLQFSETPLKDVIGHVAQESKLTVILSKKIEDAGVQADEPISINVKNLSLESALNRLLSGLNLTLMVKDETLIITTVEDAQSSENMITRVYPVADLVRDPKSGGADFDPVIDLITSTIEPDSWQDVGGPGTISGHEQSLSLVSAQRRDIHHRIEALLTTLRRARAVQGLEAARPASTEASTFTGSKSLKQRPRPGTSTRRATDAAPSGKWQLPQVYE